MAVFSVVCLSEGLNKYYWVELQKKKNSKEESWSKLDFINNLECSRSLSSYTKILIFPFTYYQVFFDGGLHSASALVITLFLAK